MIEIRNVTKKFKTGSDEFLAVDNVSFNINDGEFVAITGKSGSGKSTLLNLIGSLDRGKGNIIIDGQDLSEMNNKELAKFRNQKVGFVFQSFYLEPEYTVYENVELPLILAGKTGRKNKEVVENVLNIVGLSSKIKNKASELSGGEQQRVAIARAIVNNPSYILADEPCGNLDTLNSQNIMNLFKKLHESGKTIVIVTHDEIDAYATQRIITLLDGKVIKDEKVNTVNSI